MTPEQDQKITIDDLIEYSSENDYLVLIKIDSRGTPFFRLIDIFRMIADNVPGEKNLVDLVRKVANARGINFFKNASTFKLEGSIGKYWFVSEVLANAIIDKYLNLDRVKKTRGRPPKNYTPPKLI